MAHLLTVPIDVFRAKVQQLSIPALKGLIRGIYEEVKPMGKRLGENEVLDIERKETIIMYELQRRGYINKRDGSGLQYAQWRNQMARKNK